MNYRAVLEILKLGVPEEVALQFCLTSALWLRAARSGELWWTYCQDRNIGEEYFSSFASPLEAYKSLKAAHFTVSIQYNETLLWYDCENRRFEKKLDVPMGLILEEVRMVLMGDLSVVLLGGGAGGSAKVTKIYRNGHTAALPRMTTPRERLGAIEVSGRIYVFGGEHKQTELSSSEALNLNLTPLRKWVSQGSMLSSRADFIPTVYRNRIYLCGGRTSSCEIYDLSTRSFEPLSLISPLNTAVCALIVGQELLLLTQHTIYGYNVNTFEKNREESHDAYQIPHLMRPVIRHKSYYCATNRAAVQVSLFPDMSCTRDLNWIVYKVVKYTYDSEFNIIRLEETRGN